MTNKISRLGQNTLKTIILPVGLYILFLIVNRLTGNVTFGIGDSLDLMIRQLIPSTFIALGMCVGMLSGRWDFSIGAVVLLSAIIGANLATQFQLGAFGLLLICSLTAVIISTFSGIVYLVLRIPPMIATLGLVMVYESLSGVLFNGRGATIIANKDMTIFVKSPYIYILTVIFMALFYFVVTYTKFGYDMRSLAGGQQLAINIGVKEKKNVIMAFAFAGLFLGIAATLHVSFQVVKPAANLTSTAIMFTGITPVIIGLYLARFSNIPIGIVMGNLANNILVTGLIALGLNSTLQTVISGFALLLFIGLTGSQVNMTSGASMKMKKLAAAITQKAT